MLLMKLLQAVGNALDLVKRDETLLHVMAEELSASKGADLTPDAAEWQQRCASKRAREATWLVAASSSRRRRFAFKLA